MESFLDKLRPYPASTVVFWQIINRARASNDSSSIPTLKMGDLIYETDGEKEELFASVLAETFKDADSPDFDLIRTFIAMLKILF